MTPFGIHLRKLRDRQNITQKQMAAAIGVSAAYLSALEHGHRGKPSYALLQRIVGYLNIIWDEAELLQQKADLSDPRVVVDTTALSEKATETANLLARNITEFGDDDLEKMLQLMRKN